MGWAACVCLWIFRCSFQCGVRLLACLQACSQQVVGQGGRLRNVTEGHQGGHTGGHQGGASRVACRRVYIAQHGVA